MVVNPFIGSSLWVYHMLLMYANYLGNVIHANS